MPGECTTEGADEPVATEAPTKTSTDPTTSRHRRAIILQSLSAPAAADGSHSERQATARASHRAARARRASDRCCPDQVGTARRPRLSLTAHPQTSLLH